MKKNMLWKNVFIAFMVYIMILPLTPITVLANATWFVEWFGSNNREVTLAYNEENKDEAIMAWVQYDSSKINSTYKIMVSQYRNRAWNTPVELADESDEFYLIDACYINDKPFIAYSTGVVTHSFRGNVSSRHITLIDVENNKKHVATSAVDKVNLKFTMVDGKKVLSWVEDGAMHYLSSDGKKGKLPKQEIREIFIQTTSANVKLLPTNASEIDIDADDFLYNHSGDGRLVIDVVSSDVDVYVPKGYDALIDIFTMSGDIKVNDVNLKYLKTESRNGVIEINNSTFDMLSALNVSGAIYADGNKVGVMYINTAHNVTVTMPKRVEDYYGYAKTLYGKLQVNNTRFDSDYLPGYYSGYYSFFNEGKNEMLFIETTGNIKLNFKK